MSTNVIFSIPSATSPDEVVEIFEGYKVSIPSQGVLPASATGNGKNLVHAEIFATYQQILDITTAQRPVWQIFAAQESHSDTVYEPVNPSVWNFLPDKNGIPQNQIHAFQGHERFEGR